MAERDVETRLTVLEGDVGELTSEVFGPPRDPGRKSMRTRLHTLENDALALNAGERALEAAKAQRDAGGAERDRKLMTRVGLLLTAGNVAIAAGVGHQIARLLGL
jgi:hypothetical protein